MVNLITKSFSLNLSVLKAFFLYTPEKKTSFQTTRSYITFFLFMFHVPVFGILYFILEKNIDRQRVSDNGFVLAEMCCYIPKLLPFVTRADQIRKCIHYFELPLLTLRKDQELIIEKATKICRRNSLIFLVCLTGGFISWATKPLFISENRLPIDVWLPISNLETDLRVYYTTYIWLVLGAGYPAIASAAVEPLIAGLACLAAAHLSVLKDNLQNVYKYCEEEYENQNNNVQSKDKLIFQEIQKCIKHHYAVLQFAKLYEDCFSQVVFSQFFGSIFVLGFCCLQLSRLEPLSVDFLSTLSYFGVLLAQIYFYCYYGTRLCEESDTLTNAAYMGRWYEFDTRSKKALILLMERAKRPIVITAGKILDLSLVTFTTILRRSYSLLAVLNNKQ